MLGEDLLEEDVFRDISTPEFGEQHLTPSAENQGSDWAGMSKLSYIMVSYRSKIHFYWLGIHDRILYYAMYTQHFELSGEEIKRMEELMHVIYGSSPPITVNCVI